jgi:hypothetical protein
MKIVVILVTFGLLTGVAFAGGPGGCASRMADTAPAILMMTPSDVVDSFVVAVNSGDMKAAQGLFAAEGYVDLEGLQLTGAELATWLETDMMSKGALQVQTQQVQDDMVTLVAVQNVDGLEQEFTYQFAIRDGKIDSLVML